MNVRTDTRRRRPVSCAARRRDRSYIPFTMVSSASMPKTDNELSHVAHVGCACMRHRDAHTLSVCVRVHIHLTYLSHAMAHLRTCACAATRAFDRTDNSVAYVRARVHLVCESIRTRYTNLGKLGATKAVRHRVSQTLI